MVLQLIMVTYKKLLPFPLQHCTKNMSIWYHASINRVRVLITSYNIGIAVTSDNILIGWGNYVREANVEYLPVIIPRGLIGSRTITKIATGEGTHFVMTSDNLLFSWGYNYYAGLGDGTSTSTGQNGNCMF